MHIKFGEILSISSQDIERKGNFGINEAYTMLKITCNNPKLYPINLNVPIIHDEFLSIRSQDIERTQNFGVNQGP